MQVQAAPGGLFAATRPTRLDSVGRTGNSRFETAAANTAPTSWCFAYYRSGPTQFTWRWSDSSSGYRHPS